MFKFILLHVDIQLSQHSFLFKKKLFNTYRKYRNHNSTIELLITLYISEHSWKDNAQFNKYKLPQQMALSSYLSLLSSEVISILTSNTRDWLLGPYSDGIIHYEHDVYEINRCYSHVVAGSFSLVYTILLYEVAT